MSARRQSASFVTPLVAQAPGNRILAALSRAQYQRLAPHLEAVTLKVGQVLYEKSQPMPSVYFLSSGMVSLMLYSTEGTGVEIAVVGREGMVGAVTALSFAPTFSQAIVQVAGSGWRLPTVRLNAEMRRKGRLAGLLQNGMRGIVEQAAQNALCNRLHTVDQRLSRWLLLVSDVVESDHFALTQGNLSHMIGARITGVSAAATVLRLADKIEYKRGRITLLDREATQLTACDCYNALQSQFQHTA